MEITIKPYESRYAAQCADLLQYLWKEDKEGREARFKWGYTNNPNTPERPISVIAVSEKDEVMGFRGYHILSYDFLGVKTRVAFIADTVVSPNARRMGIFQKMTDFSFEYLKQNNIFCISDLGPSWPPYHGYKKLGFADVCQFKSKYYINIFRLLRDKLNIPNTNRELGSSKEKNNQAFYIGTNISDKVLSQVKLHTDNRFDSIKDVTTLRWKASHPDAHYCFAWVENNSGKLLSFLWFKTYDGKNYNLALFYSTNEKDIRDLFIYFKKQIKPTTVSAWCFSKTTQDCKTLSTMGLHQIPFINKFRNNPPVIVKSLKTDDQGNTDWIFNGLDIRKPESWNIDKFDADSF